MAIDRFVNWKKKGPSLARVKAVLRDYLGEGAVKITADEHRITALLVGKPSYPFKSIKAYSKYREATEVHDERWIEVYVTKGNIDVITRMTDEYTNVVAEGFAVLAARFWNGEREPY
jgi:hypothetical protein